MSIKSWWQNRWGKPKKQEPEGKSDEFSKENLREFVYLDEVSLRSLLSSLKGDLRDGTSEDSSDTLELEAEAMVEANTPLVGKAGASSRFQTSNSSSIQTSRKATVQSWFRDFRTIEGIRLVEKATPTKAATDIEALKRTDDTSLKVASRDLVRGSLVEFRVELAADPVYHLSTVTSELAGMADDYPEMFAAGGGAEVLHELAPVRKVLERLLAGLVPIRATSLDYVVIQLDGTEYVVHKELIQGLDLNSEPLQIVGVTELLAYWKDLRRVIFSEAEFTLLARISRTGIQSSWTPVKLADIFREMVPQLVAQINAAGKVPFAPQVDETSPVMHKLREALAHYATHALALSGTVLEHPDQAELAYLIETLKVRVASISDQRSAFKVLHRWIEGHVSEGISSEQSYELRETARDETGLSLFPALDTSVANASVQIGSEQKEVQVERERLLDVEIIAIYW
ncbi:hypothetical protein ICM05_08780 [Leucobacter sp. cx-42]|uniref:DUF6414 family protein n=1 Tax=unclassified Leucobacter TaxID=2621730 RepID=UPI00165D5881|nr:MULTISPECIES: hypothetical protein [unclassified Leucobacter]MBC9954737.1 hypothetical protein [Leucobacter sp. cx-42]